MFRFLRVFKMQVDLGLHESFLHAVHPEWQSFVMSALTCVDTGYLKKLSEDAGWLPGQAALLNAFSLPRSQTRYILLGESPYPRALSANGYAFWDANVRALWSETGLSREVNRATSLRNFLKMLLHAEGRLSNDFSKEAVSAIDKSFYYQTGHDFFQGLLQRGFLLLNASLVFEPGKVNYHAKMWRPFLGRLLELLAREDHQHVTLILFGKVAELVPLRQKFECMVAEHPYNLSFITNPRVVEFFKPLQLLRHL